MSIEALLFNSFGQFTNAKPYDCVATRVVTRIRHWIVLFCERTRGRTKLRLRLKQKQVDRRRRIVTVPGAQEGAPRNGVETETNKDKSSSCDVAVTCDDVRCFE